MEFTLLFDKNYDLLPLDCDANDIDWIYCSSREKLELIKAKLTRDGITTDEITKTNTLYRFTYESWEWMEVGDAVAPIKISKEIKRYLENVVEVTKAEKGNPNVAWDLIVTLKDGKKFQTNEGYCTLEELLEAIDCLKKPSILGRQIVGYELIKHID